MTKKELQDDIAQMEETYNHPSTAKDVKESLGEALKKAREQLSELNKGEGSKKKKVSDAEHLADLKKMVKSETDEDMKYVLNLEIEAYEEKIKNPGGKPVKKNQTSKTKTKNKGAMTLADCKDIIAKYTKSQKKQNQRIKKRRQQGKPAELTVPETLQKTAKSVKSKVNDIVVDDAKIPKRQIQVAERQIIDIVREILKGLPDQKSKIEFVNTISRSVMGLVKSKKAEEGIIIGDYGEDPDEGDSLSTPGNMRILSYRTLNFNISPEAQQLFESLLKYTESLSADDQINQLIVKCAEEMDAFLGVIKEVISTENATRGQFKAAVGHVMILMYWFGQLFDRLPNDVDINAFYPRFMPAFIYAIINLLEKDDTPELAAFGKRLKSAINRDRAYQSTEDWEVAYKRKGLPKQPHYNVKGKSSRKKVSANNGTLIDSKYATWEKEIAKALRNYYDCTMSDADGIIEANSFMLAQSWAADLTAKETANQIISKSKTEHDAKKSNKKLFGGIINVRTPDNLFNAHSGDGSIDI